jgi:hypothetical protein
MFIFGLLIFTNFLGWSIPAILGLPGGWIDIVLGVHESMFIVYIHLPQLLSEVLFIRLVDVMTYNFKHLLEHIECCTTHRPRKRGMVMRTYPFLAATT